MGLTYGQSTTVSSNSGINYAYANATGLMCHFLVTSLPRNLETKAVLSFKSVAPLRSVSAVVSDVACVSGT